MAEAHIEELTDGLNDQLDNLLLFAALFSGINSAFIVFSLPNLGDPAAGTNQLLSILIGTQHNASAAYMAQVVLNSQNSPQSLNVAVNVLFASSLICSLVTAFFAVVGKQWLSYLAEESSDSDERVRRTKMQNKVIGIQRYRLRALLDAYLTTTIQIALFLFMVGLILFLYTFNSLVTWFVVAFTGAGMLAYLYSTALALRDPACPFQTPVTRIILPGLFYISFNAAYTIWALISSVIIFLEREFKAAVMRWKRMGSPPHDQDDKDVKEFFEIKWDRHHATRRKLEKYLRSIPDAERVHTEAACWMIRTAEGEMVARIAALRLLAVTEPEDLSLVATYPDTTRRLRDIISVSDNVLKEEADVPADIKNREWKKLCFYVQALSHVFAGHMVIDAKQCQVMDWIYQYQKNRKRDKDQHDYTWVPARMVGVIKLLLLHLGGKHYPTMKSKREEKLRDRLYQTPFEPKCTYKALTLTAFAMKALPRIAKDQTMDRQLEEDLWHSYVKNDLHALRSNFTGAIATYADLMHFGDIQDLLPSTRHLQKLWQRIAMKEEPEDCRLTNIAPATAFDTTKEVSLTIPTIQLSPFVSDPPPNHDAIQLQRSEKDRTKGSDLTDTAPAAGTGATKQASRPNPVMQLSPPVSDPFLNLYAIQLEKPEEDRSPGSNVLAEWKAEDKASLAEACLKLAGRCTRDLPADENFEKNTEYQIVRDIWMACYKAVLRCPDRTPSTSLVETVHHLRTAYALLQAADPELANFPLVPIGDEQRGVLDSFGLRWIKDAAANDMEDWKLAKDR